MTTTPQDPSTDRGVGFTPGPWTAWAEERPTDTKVMYRWRIPARMICGVMLQPEWSEKLELCGMGYSDSEYWPTSHWDGCKRSVATGLEWRLAGEDEIETAWRGLDLLPDPWTGAPPRLSGRTRWIGAPPYEVDEFAIITRFGTSYGWKDLAKLSAAWNTRLDLSRAEGGEG